MTPATIDLGDDVAQVRFTICGTAITVFPLDELNAIHRLAVPTDGEPATHEEFWSICRDRLQTHGVATSLQMAGRWYDSLVTEHKKQTDFFAGSPASLDSTDSSKTGDGRTNSRKTNAGSSQSSKTRSKRKA